jgi:endonuclease-3
VRESLQSRRARARSLIRHFERAYPDTTIALRFTTPLELLVATILAAQCTDERVNQVTASLFQKYPRAEDYVRADPATFEGEIRSTGFFRAKTRSVLGMARALVERHGGEVPRTLETLTALPGVGRKTANVVLGNAYGVPGIAVDTHVFRVTQRLGLAKADDPDDVEVQLAEVVPRPQWTALPPHPGHGRQVCPDPGVPHLSGPGAVPLAREDRRSGSAASCPGGARAAPRLVRPRRRPRSPA